MIGAQNTVHEKLIETKDALISLQCLRDTEIDTAIQKINGLQARKQNYFSRL